MFLGQPPWTTNPSECVIHLSPNKTRLNFVQAPSWRSWGAWWKAVRLLLEGNEKAKNELSFKKNVKFYSNVSTSMSSSVCHASWTWSRKIFQPFESLAKTESGYPFERFPQVKHLFCGLLALKKLFFFEEENNFRWSRSNNCGENEANESRKVKPRPVTGSFAHDLRKRHPWDPYLTRSPSPM